MDDSELTSDEIKSWTAAIITDADLCHIDHIGYALSIGVDVDRVGHVGFLLHKEHEDKTINVPLGYCLAITTQQKPEHQVIAVVIDEGTSQCVFNIDGKRLQTTSSYPCKFKVEDVVSMKTNGYSMRSLEGIYD